MSRLRVWGVAAALAVGAGAPAIAADAPTTATDTRPWYKRMFVSAPKPAGPTVRSGPVTGGPRPSAPLPPDVVQSAVKAESDALLRRLTVCTELRQVALEKIPVDEALMRQVDEMERQANAVYQARVAALGVSKHAKAPLPTSSSSFASSFDLAPEKPLDSKTAAAKLVAPAAPVPVSGTAALGGAAAPAQEVREVNP
ncbi:hypothetical protein J8F10_29780 [Gemmata sp. G18]|uniref:Uncharacterized protein n=1 Tax=Gemmata palustris TaxID=2822762 RepID=A0ABS5C0E5_9BACT|nr:hypothetical protein [Gemmata palustris]MBP3959455.1 hypothetical protein [Gemmata palustris]